MSSQLLHLTDRVIWSWLACHFSSSTPSHWRWQGVTADTVAATVALPKGIRQSGSLPFDSRHLLKLNDRETPSCGRSTFTMGPNESPTLSDTDARSTPATSNSHTWVSLCLFPSRWCGQGTMWVPLPSSTERARFSGLVMITRSPPRLRKSTAASILGSMLPDSNCPWAM